MAHDLTVFGCGSCTFVVAETNNGDVKVEIDLRGSGVGPGPWQPNHDRLLNCTKGIRLGRRRRRGI
jgi:hypothetical protein